MAFNPTDAQRKAIDNSGNILVSAAAGSGKTAVLVERVIKLLTDSDKSINADELLIVTFTNAAAAEMRSRIENRIEEECRKFPENSSLLRQKHLLGNAKICTIDSFCIDLVRENFDKLSISPDFKITDGVTLKQIDENIIYGIVKRYINENNEAFNRLVDLVGGEFDEKNLCELFLDVYEFSRQLPFPNIWFDKLLSYYNNGVFDANCIWYKYAFTKADRTIKQMREISQNLISSFKEAGEALTPFSISVNLFLSEVQKLSDAAKTRDWDIFYNAANSFPALTLPQARGGLKEYREVKAAKEAKKLFSEKFSTSLSSVFYADLSTVNKQFDYLYPSISLFIEILKEFQENIFEEYKAQNVFTFHNIEHLALQLLCKRDENGKITVSDDGQELLEQFKEVMVDEYQDTNDLQDYLFLILSNYEQKLFVVGDVKQSIYAFRGANPINFLNKKNRYIPANIATENDPQKIILSNNFRTKTEVCDFINYFFSHFMTDKTGAINYDFEEMLVPSAKYPNVNMPAVRYDIIDCNSNEEKSSVLEARVIADYINKVMSSGNVIRKDDENLRKAKYGDFAILLRGVSNAAVFINELREQGIPVDISLEAFAENREISTVLSLLKVIDNVEADVELLSLMLSPIFAFSTDDLAQLRAEKTNGSLYSAVVNAANNGNFKATDFIKKLENYRLLSVSLNLPDLISRLLNETELLNIITAFPDGSRRKNNLLILIEMARQYLSNGTNNLGKFVSYIDKLSKSGAKSASIKSGNSVKIMTMHASKGLQFPVCIVAGTDKRFNDSDRKKSACYGTKYGIGLKYFDEDLKKPISTVSREAIIDYEKMSTLEEELRLLYVAMTRTQDMLLFVSAFENLEAALEKYKNRLVMHGCEITSGFFEYTSSFADWLIPSLLLHPDGKVLRSLGDTFTISDDNSHVSINLYDANEILSKEKSVSEDFSTADNELVNELRQNINYEYPYNEILKLRSKTSVSALANKAESDKFAFTATPSFMNSGNISATQRGTAMHKVMQYFDFSKADDIDGELDRLYEWQYISENEYNSLNRDAIIAFFKSDVFSRIKNAQIVKREMQFLTEVSVNEIDSTLDEKLSEEKIVIQGAVDICFIENGEIVILDFKTDRVEDISDLMEAYSGQLSLYASAASKIFKMPIKEKIIYSFHLSDSISF